MFPFFVAEDYPWPPKYIDGEPGRTKLISFKERVGVQLIRDVFTTPDDLAYKVAAAVGRYSAKERVGSLGARLKTSLGTADLNARSLAQGRSLSDAPEDTRDKVLRLLGELRETIDTFPEPGGRDPMLDPDTLLALAEGLMAQCKWLEAGRQLAEYAAARPEDWEANILRGVAFANSRAGFETDLASLRAYNEAIAFLPRDIEPNRKARLFAYRGAMLKRLGRVEEAEADLVTQFESEPKSQPLFCDRSPDTCFALNALHFLLRPFWGETRVRNPHERVAPFGCEKGSALGCC